MPQIPNHGQESFESASDNTSMPQIPNHGQESFKSAPDNTHMPEIPNHGQESFKSAPDNTFMPQEYHEGSRREPYPYPHTPDSTYAHLTPSAARTSMPVPNRREALPDPHKPAGTAREEVPISPVQIIILSYLLTCGSCSL